MLQFWCYRVANSSNAANLTLRRADFISCISLPSLPCQVKVSCFAGVLFDSGQMWPYTCFLHSVLCLCGLRDVHGYVWNPSAASAVVAAFCGCPKMALLSAAPAAPATFLILFFFSCSPLPGVSLPFRSPSFSSNCFLTACGLSQKPIGRKLDDGYREKQHGGSCRRVVAMCRQIYIYIYLKLYIYIYINNMRMCVRTMLTSNIHRPDISSKIQYFHIFSPSLTMANYIFSINATCL